MSKLKFGETLWERCASDDLQNTPLKNETSDILKAVQTNKLIIYAIFNMSNYSFMKKGKRSVRYL